MEDCYYSLQYTEGGVDHYNLYDKVEFPVNALRNTKWAETLMLFRRVVVQVRPEPSLDLCHAHPLA
jgi:hypothetical protein